jgi:hypothetical protein
MGWATTFKIPFWSFCKMDIVAVQCAYRQKGDKCDAITTSIS